MLSIGNSSRVKRFCFPTSMVWPGCSAVFSQQHYDCKSCLYHIHAAKNYFATVMYYVHEHTHTTAFARPYSPTVHSARTDVCCKA